MEFQYALRFESGERRGEVVPISIVAAQGGTFTIGRKPGNSLQVTDPSVSGRHAELEIGTDSVGIRDLDSTNGTHVGGRRVRQAALGHLDDFVLGAVEFTLLDNSAGAGNGATGFETDEIMLEAPDELELEPAPTRVPSKAPKSAPERATAPARAAEPIAPALSDTQMQPRDEALEITAEDLARSRRSSKLGPLLVVVLAAVGGGVWWWLGQRSGDEGGGRRQAAAMAVEPPAGNLLTAGYSFERSEGWTVDESLAATFDPTAGARRSGRRGVRAEVHGGEAAVLESDPVRVKSSARALRAVAHVRGDAEGKMWLGLRFSARDGSATTTVWSSPTDLGEEWREVTLFGVAPAGMDEARVLVRAEGSGGARPEGDVDSGVVPSQVDVDDVALVPDSATKLSRFEHDEWSIVPLGAVGPGSARALAVSALDQTLISSLRVVLPDAGLDVSPLSFVENEGGRAKFLVLAGAGELVVRAEAPLVAAGVATMAEEGFASHGTSFERTGVTSLLLGSDATLVRIGFMVPTDVQARPAGDDLVVRANVTASADLTVQIDFAEERTRAETLARQAQTERRNGDPGAALRTWTELLQTVPFDQRLVDLAATEQGELVAEGREALRALESEVQRARFFGLADLYREKLARVNELGARYAGSPIEAQCAELSGAIRQELAALDADRDRYEALRREAIETVLRRRGAEDLAERMAEGDGEGGGR